MFLFYSNIHQQSAFINETILAYYMLFKYSLPAGIGCNLYTGRLY